MIGKMLNWVEKWQAHNIFLFGVISNGLLREFSDTMTDIGSDTFRNNLATRLEFAASLLTSATGCVEFYLKLLGFFGHFLVIKWPGMESIYNLNWMSISTGRHLEILSGPPSNYRCYPPSWFPEPLTMWQCAISKKWNAFSKYLVFVDSKERQQ